MCVGGGEGVERKGEGGWEWVAGLEGVWVEPGQLGKEP